MKISRKTIIEMLISNPVTEKEVGFNSGLITILKESIIPRYNESIRENLTLLKNKLPNFDEYSDERLLELDGYIKNTQKLSGVKLIKEVSCIGLREAKDIIDYIIPLYQK
jgi:hypothetical protein